MAYSNKLSDREKDLFGMEYQSVIKTQYKGRFNIIQFFATQYKELKHLMMGKNLQDNIYIYSLNDESDKVKSQANNLVAFVYNKLKTEWDEEGKKWKALWDFSTKKFKFQLIQNLCNMFFIATKITQQIFYELTDHGKDKDVLDALWSEMKWTMNFVKFKTTVDRVWQESFERCLLLLQLHQFLNEDGCEYFKNFFGEEKLPADTIDRVQRFTTLYQKLADQCVWFKFYKFGALEDFQPIHRPYLFALGRYIFQCLEECCSGPHEANQLKVYRYIYDRLKGTLTRYFRDINSEFYNLKLSLLDYIIALSEGLNQTIIHYQTTNFEIEALEQIMINSIKQLYHEVCLHTNSSKFTNMSQFILKMKDYNSLLYNFGSNEEFSKHTLLQISIKIYSYIKIVSQVSLKHSQFCKEREQQIDLYENKKKLERNILEEQLVCYKFLGKICNKIEIQRNNKTIEQHYFQVLPKCYYLSNQTKQYFIKNVDRTNHQTKLVGLYDYIDIFEQEMDYNVNVSKLFGKQTYIYQFFCTSDSFYQEVLLLIISLVINLLLLNDYENEVGKYVYKGRFQDAIQALAVIDAVIAGIFVIWWIALKYKLKMKLEQFKYFSIHPEKKRLSLTEKINVNIYKGLINQGDMFIFCFHVACMLLGIFISPGFYGIVLISIIHLSKLLKYVIQSVTRHKEQLIITYILGLIIMYAYALFAHTFFYVGFEQYASDGVVHSQSNNTVVINSEQPCDTLFHCFWSVINIDFRSGEGIGSLMLPESYSSTNRKFFIARQFFEISFFLIIYVILLNIIFGIIIDTFSEMRKENQEFQKDIDLRCFICNNERIVFDKEGISFKYHTQNEHNVWDYVNFLIYMRTKTTKDCSGVQHELLSKIKKGQLTWFPRKHALSLKKNQQDENEVEIDDVQKYLMKMDQRMQKQLDEIQTSMKDMDTQIKGLDQKIKDLEKKPNEQQPAAQQQQQQQQQ